MVVKIELTFPMLPPSKLSANNRRTSHWSRQYKDSRDSNETFRILLEQQLRDRYPDVLKDAPYEGPFSVEWRIVFPNNRKRDLDNVFGSLKGWMDQLKILWVDDSVTYVNKLCISGSYEKEIERTDLIICTTDANLSD